MKRPGLLVLVVAAFFPAVKAEEPVEEGASNARKDLYRALATRSEEGMKSALLVLVRAGGRQNMDAILRALSKIPEDDDELYWGLIQGACSFLDREALAQLGESILSARTTGRARDLMLGLARNRSPHVVVAMAPLVEKGQPDLQLMAVEKIATVSSPDAVDVLIAVLKREEQKKDSELRDLAVHGLQVITGKEYTTNSVNWEGWWAKNRDRPLTGRQPVETGRTTTGTVVDELDHQRVHGFEGLERSPKKSVVVLSAEYPERDLNNSSKHGGSTIQDVLGRMGIPHEVVKRPDFEKYDLRGAGALLINCAQFHEFCICPDCKPGGTVHNRLYQCTGCEKHKKFSAKLSGAAIKKIQTFVKRGGFLFCEDWTVKEVLERAFPQYVSAGAVLKEGQASVTPARGRASHPYLRGIFSPEISPDEEAEGRAGDGGGEKRPKEGTTVKKPEEEPEEKAKVGAELVKIKHRWTIDDESWALRVGDGSKVVVLLTSAKKTGPVALCFRPGAENADAGSAPRGGPGMVLQVLSHFGRQESTQDEYSLQNLLLNFLIAANVARNEGELAKKPAKAVGNEGKEGGPASKEGKGEAEPKEGKGGSPPKEGQGSAEGKGAAGGSGQEKTGKDGKAGGNAGPGLSQTE